MFAALHCRHRIAPMNAPPAASNPPPPSSIDERDIDLMFLIALHGSAPFRAALVKKLSGMAIAEFIGAWLEVHTEEGETHLLLKVLTEAGERLGSLSESRSTRRPGGGRASVADREGKWAGRRVIGIASSHAFARPNAFKEIGLDKSQRFLLGSSSPIRAACGEARDTALPSQTGGNAGVAASRHGKRPPFFPVLAALNLRRGGITRQRRGNCNVAVTFACGLEATQRPAARPASDEARQTRAAKCHATQPFERATKSAPENARRNHASVGPPSMTSCSGPRLRR